MRHSNMRREVTLGLALALSVTGAAWCQVRPRRPQGPSPVMAEDGRLHGLGLIYQDPRTVPDWHEVHPGQTRAAAPLPASVLNTADLPPVGNQGTQFSCVAWATAYATLTYMEAKAHGWDPSDPARIMSPAYVYNQGHLPEDASMTFSDATDLLSTLGCTTLDRMPYTQNDNTSWPSEVDYREAMSNRVLPGSVTWVDTTQPGGIEAVKQILSQGEIGFAGMWLYGNFNTISTYSYNYCLADVPGGGLIQYLAHAVAIVGYDDDRVTDDGVGAFRCMNSWGAGWGDQGFFWLSYQAAADPDMRIFQGFFATYQITSGSPTWAAVFQISSPRFRDLAVTLSNGAGAVRPWHLSSWADPRSRDAGISAPPGRVWVDISDLAVPSGPFPLTLSVTDAFNPDQAGQVVSFAVVDLASGQGTLSRDPPVPIEPLAPPQLLSNGGFESGLTGWLPWHAGAGDMPVVSSEQAHDGSHSAWLSAGGGEGQSGLSRVLAIPTAPSALVFWYDPFRQGGGPEDYQVAGLTDEQGRPQTLLLYLDSDAESWQPVYTDLSPYAGMTMQLNFSVYHDGTPGGSTALYVDDVGFCPEVPTEIAIPAMVASPPSIGDVAGLAGPFRLKITGGNFNAGTAVYVGGADSPWADVMLKNPGKLLLKGGRSLKSLFPKGQSVAVELVNPDGGTAETHFTR